MRMRDDLAAVLHLLQVRAGGRPEHQAIGTDPSAPLGADQPAGWDHMRSRGGQTGHRPGALDRGHGTRERAPGPRGKPPRRAPIKSVSADRRLGGYLVGYLSRADAAAYLPGLQLLVRSNPGRFVALNGVIVGGGERPDGLGLLGVFLDHDPADFGLRSQQVGYGGTLRTGHSEALATDLEDDSYDLSWLSALSGNDARDIKKLRAMLDTESDPIDRHYMLCELEGRLYKNRDAFASALDEFDAVCRQHDAEMGTIRPALLSKFGVIPLIDMYRQAAVRCQKARDWEPVRVWAERGLTVYGADAARPEAVADLHKRREYANAKIEAGAMPRTRGPAEVVVAATSPQISDEIETLVCAVWGGVSARA